MTRRVLTLSAFAAGLVAVAALAQPPAADKGGAKKADAKKADAPDAAIEAALGHDPDVRMARAKMHLAEAELAKARQAVTGKVLTLRSAIADQKRAVATADDAFKLVNKSFAAGHASTAEMLTARDRLEVAQAALARSETELKLVTGGAGVPGAKPAVPCFGALQGAENCTACHAVGGPRTDAGTALQLLAFAGAKATPTTGPVADRIRLALDQPVRLGKKGDEVLFDKALEVFRASGLDVPVRQRPAVQVVVVTDGEELPIGAWLQLYQDMAGDDNKGFAFYVREYGLLAATKDTAPPDAPTLTAFWKQPKPAEAKK